MSLSTKFIFGFLIIGWSLCIVMMIRSAKREKEERRDNTETTMYPPELVSYSLHCKMYRVRDKFVDRVVYFTECDTFVTSQVTDTK